MITKDKSREDILKAAIRAFPGRKLVVSTNLPYPLSVAKELGEVWVVDATIDKILYSSRRANHVAWEALIKIANGIKPGLGMRPVEEPLPRKFKERLLRELQDRWVVSAFGTDAIPKAKDKSTLESFEWFHEWLGL